MKEKGFEIPDFANEREVKAIRHFNDVLGRLMDRRIKVIAREGIYRKSKLAWKFATYQQPMLYRVVMLAEGLADCWNSGNTLCAFLAGRALVETVSVFVTFQQKTAKLTSAKDILGLDALVMNRIFSSRDEDFLSDNPDLKATNIITFIEQLDKELLPGLRAHYNHLSERCHPNMAGHSRFFGDIDLETDVTTYSDNYNSAFNLTQLLGAASSIGLYEKILKKSDSSILEIAKIQDSIDPVK